MKKILIFGIIMALTLLILGCNDRHDRYGPLTPEEELKVKLGGVNINIPDEYSVNFDFSYGSPGGDRSWEVSYGVASGEYTACSGEYHFSGQGDEKTEPCTLEMLQTSEIALFPKMNDIVTKVNTNFQTEVFVLNAADRDCYYVENEDGYAYGVVCFNSEKELVTYLAKGGYGSAETIWLLNDYDLTDEVEDLMG